MTQLFTVDFTYRTLVLKSLVLSLFIVTACISGVGEVKAVTFDLTFTLSDYWSEENTYGAEPGSPVDKNENGVIESNYDFTVAYFTANTDKAVYALGEKISLSATALGQICQNWEPRVTITTTFEGTTIKLIDNGVAGFQQSYLYGSGELIAPMVPGEYSIQIEGCYDNAYEKDMAGCVARSIPITVVDIGTPEIKPDIAATIQAPAAGAVYKVGNVIPVNVTAVNVESTDIPEAGWAGIDVDINSDDDSNDDAPWDDAHDRYYAVPDGETTLGTFTIGQSKPFSYPVNDLPVGDHQIRFEVDSTDTIVESDSYNNYTPWRTIHIISGDLTVSPASITSGSSGSVSWTTENTDGFTCQVESDSGVVVGTGANGTNVSTGVLTQDAMYILSCEGVALDGPVVLDVVSVSESPNLTVTRKLVNQGDTTTLQWDTNNGDETSCILSGGSLTTNPLLTDGGDVNTGSEDVVVNAQTIYTLTCPLGVATVLVEVVSSGYES